MPRERWTDGFLDDMRGEGDRLADGAVATLFAEGSVGAVNRLMRTLVQNDGLPSEGLPPVIVDYLARTAALPVMDPALVARAQALFRVFGPEVLIVLGFYGLPAAYAAEKGVRVLCRTGRLSRDPLQRLRETTQMVMDVLAEGGLGPGGRGVRSAQKVRLMHAAVRHLLRHDPREPWDASLGLPLNQEDMAGTLMTFGYLVLDGLARLGVALEARDREAYLHVWHVVGRLMGVREELIPADFDEARELTRAIHRRQIAPSPEGRALTAALLSGYRGFLPEPLRGAPASLIHFFLGRDPFDGRDVAAMLGVPPGDARGRVACLAVEAHARLASAARGGLPAHVLGHVNRRLIEGMLRAPRGGAPAPFAIPHAIEARAVAAT